MYTQKGFRIFLKRIILNNMVLYWLWFYLVRKRKGLEATFFQRDTDVYIDGYPRSGNTFIIYLINRVLPELNVIHHLHAVAPIKIALLLGIPTLIIVRDPMECISSKYLKHFSMRGIKFSPEINDKLLNEFISGYLNYYSFVLKNRKRISLICFSELIKSPHLVLNQIKNYLNINQTISDDALIRIRKSYKGATNTMGSSLPNPTKEQFKFIVKNHITKSNKYLRILELYKSITNK